MIVVVVAVVFVAVFYLQNLSTLRLAQQFRKMIHVLKPNEPIESNKFNNNTTTNNNVNNINDNNNNSNNSDNTTSVAASSMLNRGKLVLNETQYRAACTKNGR